MLKQKFNKRHKGKIYFMLATLRLSNHDTHQIIQGHNKKSITPEYKNQFCKNSNTSKQKATRLKLGQIPNQIINQEMTNILVYREGEREREN